MSQAARIRDRAIARIMQGERERREIDARFPRPSEPDPMYGRKVVVDRGVGESFTVHHVVCNACGAVDPPQPFHVCKPKGAPDYSLVSRIAEALRGVTRDPLFTAGALAAGRTPCTTARCAGCGRHDVRFVPDASLLECVGCGAQRFRVERARVDWREEVREVTAWRNPWPSVAGEGDEDCRTWVGYIVDPANEPRYFERLACLRHWPTCCPCLHRGADRVDTAHAIECRTCKRLYEVPK